MSKKICFAFDGRRKPDPYHGRDDIDSLIQVSEEYGYEIVRTYDDGLFCDGGDYRSVARRIEEEGPNWVRYSDEYLKEIEDVEILVIMYNGVNKVLLDHAKELKYIAVMRSGLENVDVEECKKRGIKVSNCPGKVSEPVSEMACAMILDVLRSITKVNKGEVGFKAVESSQLSYETTIGIVGFGIIGHKVAKKLGGFDFKFIAYDPFGSQEDADKLNVKLVELDELMSTADIITVHSRLLPATANMIGEHEISLMKPNACLVNTARAGLVDEEALIEALKEKRIKGAALDVFKQEPLPDDHIFHKLDNVVLTPHMAGNAGDVMMLSVRMMMEEIVRYMKGDKLAHQVA
jgi:D-3-phosphoglycerate dehydrogenase